jgi:acetate kinase
MNVLVLNAGSSTLKFRLFQMGPGEELLAEGIVEKWGTPDPALRLKRAGQPEQRQPVAAENPGQAAEHAITACKPLGIDALGHRVVHGGGRYFEPARINPQVIAGIAEVAALAPLHNRLALEGVEAGMRLLPDVPAFAVFDTAFHHHMPEVAATYAIPYDLAREHGLRRYGFHGISHRYVSGLLLKCLNREPAGTRLITCHLGNGSSLCAVRDGKSVDTSMGLTPMEGLVMGTRCGDIDPGLVLHLITALKMSASDVDNLLNRRSGLLGISGASGDMRDVEKAAQSGDARAELALELLAYRIRKYIGAYAAAMGGLDAIAFSGGIGEHSSATRQRACNSLDFLGIKLDSVRNGSAAADRPIRISADDSAVQVWGIPTDEELQIAREGVALLRTGL